MQQLLLARTDRFQTGPVFEALTGGCVLHRVTCTDMTGCNNIILAVSVATTFPHRVLLQDRGQTSEAFVVSSVLTLNGYRNGSRTSLNIEFTLVYNRKEDFIDRSVWNTTTEEIFCAYYVIPSRIWSRHGCDVTRRDTYTVACKCNHTTSFALLMKVKPFEVPQGHEVALNVITCIGCGVSMVTVFIALTVFTCVRALNSERVAVHKNLCLAILCSQITFLAGIKATQHKTVCQVTAVILHYFFTSVFTWMLVEGLHLYTQVVQVFGTERSRTNYYLFFGWGIPVVMVTISVAADFEGYGSRKSCWLSIERNTIWAFVGPAIAVVIVNVIILIMVLRIVVTSATPGRARHFDQIRAGVKAAVFLLPLLGLTWMFGLLSINQDLLVFEYLFAFFNSLQGFFVFMFHCVLNSEVRQALGRLRERHVMIHGGLQSLETEDSPPGTSEEISVHVKVRGIMDASAPTSFRRFRVLAALSGHTGGAAPRAGSTEGSSTGSSSGSSPV